MQPELYEAEEPWCILIIIYFDNEMNEMKITIYKARTTRSVVSESEARGNFYLGSNVCQRADNQTSGDTSQESTRSLVKNCYQLVIHPWKF